MSSQLDLTPFIDALEDICEQMSDSGKSELMGKISKYLETKTKADIAAQRAPDGGGWAARKNSGSASGRMFKKIGSQLSIRQKADALQVGWFGRTGRIASIHHYGLSQRLRFGMAKYAARELIGITPDDIDEIESLIIDHFNA